MVPSARQAIACVLFIFIATVCSQSQVAPVKTATISGKVTLKNKALAGVMVAARIRDSPGPDRSRYRATTDQNGNYRITNVLPGSYQVAPLAPGMVRENELVPKSVVVDEGDNVEDVNFSMVRGGVITGKVTDADGKPMIEEEVNFEIVDGPYAQIPVNSGGVMTDDRGIYRAFGLLAGKYKVFAGQGGNRLPGDMRTYQETYYPSVTDKTKATDVEVTEGSEARDIDITLGRPLTSFRVTGKIVDSETGKPVPNLRYGIFKGNPDSGGHSTGGDLSNANGEFKFEGVMPGTYSVFVMGEQNTEVRADPVSFEVVDHDVTGLVLKTVKGSSVSGVVVMEGVEDPAAITKDRKLWVNAMAPPRAGRFYGGFSGAVGPDGSFRINGLSPGVLHFALSLYGSDGNKPIALERVERDGILQTSGVTIKDGEQVTGVRLVAKLLTATIRGQVKVEDGELPADARLSVWLEPLDESHRVMNSNSSPQIDARGRFLIDGVAAGTYEINVAVFENGRNDTSRIFKQQVTVADNSVSDVTVTIKLKP